MLPKPGKRHKVIQAEITASQNNKLFEKLSIGRLILEERKLILYLQFGFRSKHSTTDQIHRITDPLRTLFNTGKTVQSSSLMSFRNSVLSGIKDCKNCYREGKHSYWNPTYLGIFRVRQEANFQKINAGFPQGSVPIIVTYPRSTKWRLQCMPITWPTLNSLVVIPRNGSEILHKTQLVVHKNITYITYY